MKNQNLEPLDMADVKKMYFGGFVDVENVTIPRITLEKIKRCIAFNGSDSMFVGRAIGSVLETEFKQKTMFNIPVVESNDMVNVGTVNLPLYVLKHLDERLPDVPQSERLSMVASFLVVIAESYINKEIDLSLPTSAEIPLPVKKAS